MILTINLYSLQRVMLQFLLIFNIKKNNIRIFRIQIHSTFQVV
jgi:hypothetical protein